MGFFDLNIPYEGSSPADKARRIKLVTKAMELGYSGIAYNRTMKGVMSDRDRCSIPLLSLSSLLKVAPSLSASVSFHRDLLGVPRTSPFRQYTRLTVSADSVSQAQALNSGNPVLKSYDLVAVKPLNQTSFDHACEKSEVDIISIEFSDRLPFRLKLPMVKTAIRRGVYFEITYSNLIADVQVRRQMISNAKLLVDWTGGKNLIISSGGSSVNEIRGPYDVANLLSLLGISMERGKASISKSCRTVISNALKKRQFHKETIKVEPIESCKKYDTDGLWSLDRQKWDPISSGNGDLIFNDSDKPSSVFKEASKPRKAIDFASVIDSVSSHGFSVKDLLPEKEPVPLIPKGGINLLDTTSDIDYSTSSREQEPNRINATCMIDQISSYETVDVEETMTRIECLKDGDVILKEPTFNELSGEPVVQGGNFVVDTKMEDAEILGSDDDNDVSLRSLNNPVVKLVDDMCPPFDETQPKSSLKEILQVAADSSSRNNIDSVTDDIDSPAAVMEPLPGVAVDDLEQKEDLSFPGEAKVNPKRFYHQHLAFPLKRLLDPANRQMRGRKRRRKV